ncbi:MAG: hypothetical protein CMH57_12770 [Myxococcales bacterium]|nr:hypothetical protein [Myxococcales bacterium]
MPKIISPRTLAAQVVQRVLDDGAYSNIALDAAFKRHPKLSRRNRGLATELTYGTLTWLRPIDVVLGKHVHRKFKSLDRDVLAVLRVATYQFMKLDRIPEHAIISEAGRSVRSMRRGNRIVNFVNGVLRSMQRTREEQEARRNEEAGVYKHPNKPQGRYVSPASKGAREDRDKDAPKKKDPSAPNTRDLLNLPRVNPKQWPTRYIGEGWSLPDWMAERWIERFGLEEAEALARSLTERPPLSVRVSPWSQAGGKHLSPRDQQGQRAGLGRKLDAALSELSPMGLLLPQSSAEATRLLQQGLITHQDEAAQLVAMLANPRKNDRTLDACAGLGGKTAHLAELMHDPGEERLVALDPNESKLSLLGETFERLKLKPPTVVHGDLTEIKDALGEPFDLIVVDAPCSGLGVMRRHPEIRWTRTAEDIASLAKLQRDLLDAAATHLKPGGRLIYSVCTFTLEEGEQQVADFLSRHDDFELDLEGGNSRVSWKKLDQTAHGYNLLPHRTQADGFFISRLKRKSA